jgi:hypothetical protein
VKNLKYCVSSLMILDAIAAGSSAQAQEAQDKHYSTPIGLVQNEMLRVQVVPAGARIQTAPSTCNANVTVDILQANNLQVLSSSGPVPVMIGNSLTFDFSPFQAMAASRVEVIVAVTVTRTPGRPSERSALQNVCPIVGSAQVVDSASGRTELSIDVYSDAKPWSW